MYLQFATLFISFVSYLVLFEKLKCCYSDLKTSVSKVAYSYIIELDSIFLLVKETRRDVMDMKKKMNESESKLKAIHDHL